MYRKKEGGNMKNVGEKNREERAKYKERKEYILKDNKYI